MNIIKSFKVATTLNAYRIVGGLSGTANAVAYPESAQHNIYGITLDTVKDITQGIPVCMSGIAKLYFNDTVAAHGIVASDTSGRGIPLTLAVTSTSATLAKAYVGYLIGPAVAATGTIADVLVAPGYSR